MQLEDRIRRNASTAYRNVEGEGLVMNPTDSMLHLLNETGSAIWEYLKEPHTVQEVLAMVLDRFDCDPETATEDILTFLQTLQEQQLVEKEN
jgi:hypothetical protein